MTHAYDEHFNSTALTKLQDKKFEMFRVLSTVAVFQSTYANAYNPFSSASVEEIIVYTSPNPFAPSFLTQSTANLTTVSTTPFAYLVSKLTTETYLEDPFIFTELCHGTTELCSFFSASLKSDKGEM